MFFIKLIVKMGLFVMIKIYGFGPINFFIFLENTFK